MSDETLVADINALTAENRGLRLLLDQAEARVAALEQELFEAGVRYGVLWTHREALTAALTQIAGETTWTRGQMIDCAVDALHALDAARGA